MHGTSTAASEMKRFMVSSSNRVPNDSAVRLARLTGKKQSARSAGSHIVAPPGELSDSDPRGVRHRHIASDGFRVKVRAVVATLASPFDHADLAYVAPAALIGPGPTL